MKSSPYASAGSDPRPVTVRPGDVLGGKYRVERVLGKGAMGVVVAALHVELDEPRAIKLMLPSVLGDAENVERFFREARAAARLRSKHAAIIHDIGRLDDGAPFIVMEYLEGTDLKSVLDARGHLEIGEGVRLVVEACEAIGEAHALGIIHRDLKPGNLFITRSVSGAPLLKVVDFGVAKVPERQGRSGLTKMHTMLGTPLYMSPEQMRGASAVDARSDVWALGAILYRTLTGSTPFTGDSVPAICSAALHETPAPPSALVGSIPAALDAVILRCLEKDPAARFASAGELASALQPFADGGAARRALTGGAAQPSAPAVPLVAAHDRPGVSRLASTFLASAPADSTLHDTSNATARAAAWSQPVGGASASARGGSAKGRRGVVAAIVVALGSAVGIGGAFVLTRSGPPKDAGSAQPVRTSSADVARGAAPDPRGAASASNDVAASSVAPALGSPSTLANASAAPTGSASAAPTAASIATGQAVARPPPGAPPPLPLPPPRPSDAFGRSRQ